MSESATKDRGFILVGVDGSEPSLAALRWAAWQATLTGAALRVLVSWELPSFTGWAPVFPLEYDPEQIAGKILDEALRDALGPDSGAGTEGLAVERIVVEGHPAPALIAAAHGAELLVVGSQGHGAFTGMLIGSVSEHLVAHAPCSVVVVRQEQSG